MSFKLVSMVEKLEMVEVSGIEGVVIGVMDRKGLSMVENGDIETTARRGTFDTKKGFQGYSSLTFDDGSTLDCLRKDLQVAPLRGVSSGDLRLRLNILKVLGASKESREAEPSPKRCRTGIRTSKPRVSCTMNLLEPIPYLPNDRFE